MDSEGWYSSKWGSLPKKINICQLISQGLGNLLFRIQLKWFSVFVKPLSRPWPHASEMTDWWPEKKNLRAGVLDVPPKRGKVYITNLVSHEKNPPTLHYTGWLIGILIAVYYNPYITGWYNPLYNPTNQGFFHCSIINLIWLPESLSFRSFL